MSNKDPKRKLPCKLINYNWNIKNKSYFHIDINNCSISRTNKNNKNTNNFSFNNGFRILIYVLLIDDNKYESDKYDYISSYNYFNNSKSSSRIDNYDFNDDEFDNEDKIKSSSKSISKSKSNKDIALSPIIFNDDDNEDKIKSSSKSKKKCPDDKIYNPKTKRCVSKNGKIGKELLNLN